TLVVVKAMPRGFGYAGECGDEALNGLPERVERAARAYGRDFSDSLALALSEILTNIRDHAYSGLPGRIELDARFRRDGVFVKLRDWGSAFDPAKTRPPALGELVESGFGLYLARESLDVLGYEKGANGANEWRLEKYRRKD
ncbi:MAG: ATP-binding protein, partial [Spirochaetaceae bacterium]|nr:ATP-binding protein [Spirochaetaceae bacterium]